MSVREMEAITVGLDETMDIDMIDQGPQFVSTWFVNSTTAASQSLARRWPGCTRRRHAFVDHIPQSEYPAGALAALISHLVRGMERGTMSEARDAEGVEPLADINLCAWQCRAACSRFRR